MRFQHNRASRKSEALARSIIEKIPTLGKPVRKFMVHLLILFLSLRGRYTFTQMARYSPYCQKSFRNHFARGFPFLSFNQALVSQYVSGECVLAFDPSFIPKSGQATPGIDYFWNGCHQRKEKGLELGGLALVSLEQNAAFHLEAIQSPDQKTLQARGITSIDQFAALIVERAATLRALSPYLAVDGQFAKYKFVSAAVENGLHIVGKLRKDADMRYLYTGPQKDGPGRPTQFDGKINWKNIRKGKGAFKCTYLEEGFFLWEAVVHSVCFKRHVKVICLQQEKDNRLTGKYDLLYTTDTGLPGKKVLQYYRARFQIELLFRDAKQHTGLTHCQARHHVRMHTHWNASLTAVTLARIAHRPAKGKPFSMAKIKGLYFNEQMLELFLSSLEINPNLMKIQKRLDKLRNYGLIRA